jgi:hypothetical protein
MNQTITIKESSYRLLVGLAEEYLHHIKEHVNAAHSVLESASQAQSSPVTTDQEPPLCGVHNIPMVWQKGKRGDFWSCHEKDPDGSYCSYRPPTT